MASPRMFRAVRVGVLLGGALPAVLGGCLGTNPRYDGDGTGGGGGTGSSGSGTGEASGSSATGTSKGTVGGTGGATSAAGTGMMTGAMTGTSAGTGMGTGTGFTCSNGETLCVKNNVGLCKDLQTDKNNCGECDNKCDGSETCDNGECKGG